MNDNDRRHYDMLVRVREFGANHAHLFPASSPAQQAFGEVAAAIGDIESHDVTETSASASARATRKLEARKALIERLTLIATTAQVLPGTSPDFKAQFRVPDSIKAQLLITTARQFAQHATACADQFVAHGLAPTFLADLAAGVQQLEEALRDRGAGRDQQMAARARIRAALATALASVRRLDVIVRNHVVSDSALRGVWRRNRRVEYPVRSRRGGARPSSDVPGQGHTAKAEPSVALVKVDTPAPSL
jgi:hypothetical protein